MTIAFWCVLAAGLLPYVFVVIGKSGGLDNNSPRQAALTLTGVRQRAYWAHQNVLGNPATGHALRESLAAKSLHIPELEGLSDLQATEWMHKQHMGWVSRRDGSQAGVIFAERFFFRDEWDHLPGLREYLAKEARPR